MDVKKTMIAGALLFITATLAQADGEKSFSVKTQGGISIEDTSGDYKFGLGGFFQWDTDYFDGLYNNGADGSENKLRRARLIFTGQVPNDIKFVLMSNYNNTKKEVQFLKALVEYSGLSSFNITVGRFKEPFGMEALSSAKWLTTIERSVLFSKSTPNLAGLFHDFGFMLSRNNPKYTWAVGLFDDGSEDVNGKDNMALTGRVTYTPINNPNNLLHIGASWSDRQVEDNTNLAINFPLAVNAAIGTELLNTTVDNLIQSGLEFGYQNGSFNIQSEYIQLDGDSNTGTPDIQVDDFYLQFSYLLTGESKKYKKGVFGPVKFNGKPAWELVGKLEHIETDTANLATTEADITTIGFNYYLNQHAKLALNLISAETQGVGEPNDGDAISLRLQMGF